MKKTIKIIDLLNKKANGEELPKKVKWRSVVFVYYDGDYINDIKFSLFHHDEDEYSLLEMLNDEVEIIEDNKIEKLTFDDTDVCCVDGLMKQSLNIKNKVNEIIDLLNEMDKGE